MAPPKARSTFLAGIPRSLASATLFLKPSEKMTLSSRPRWRLVQSYCKALLVFWRRFGAMHDVLTLWRMRLQTSYVGV